MLIRPYHVYSINRMISSFKDLQIDDVETASYIGCIIAADEEHFVRELLSPSNALFSIRRYRPKTGDFSKVDGVMFVFQIRGETLEIRKYLI